MRSKGLRRFTTRFLLATLSLAIIFSGASVDRVYAAIAMCEGNYRGVDSCQGFFTKQTSPDPFGNADFIFADGLHTNNVDDFVDRVKMLLGQNTPGDGNRNSTGAAFLILNMLGYDAGMVSSKNDGVAKARARFDDWEARVRYADGKGQVDWNKEISTATAPQLGASNGHYRNSSWLNDIKDNIFNMEQFDVIEVIEFNYGGNQYFRIQRICGNLVGNLAALPAVPSPNFQAISRVSGWGEGETATVDAQGVASFGHYLWVTQYGSSNYLVNFSIQRAISTASGACPGNGSWSTIYTNNALIDRDGYIPLWGYTDVMPAVNRDTTRLICQRVVINNTGGANNISTWRIQAAANITNGNVSMNVSGGGYYEPGQTATLTGTVTGQQGGAAPFSVSYTMNFPQTIPGMAAVPGTGAFSQTFNVGGSVTRSRVYTITIPANAQAGDKACLRVAVTSPTLDRYFGGSSNRTAESCVTVVYKSVAAVQGGDVAAGGAFENAGVCGPSALSSVAGWPNAPVYNAAGSSHAVFATNRIFGFATAKATTPPSLLAFANTSGSGEHYGGTFGTMKCINDYWSAKQVTASAGSVVAALNDAGSGSYEFTTGTQILGANNMTLDPGQKKVFYIDGDLRIGKDILYQDRGNWSSVSQIPGLKVIVRGNIYIENDVERLDGIYVAQPNGATGGEIFTCVNSSGTPISTAASNYYDECKTQLIVNGTFTAKKVHLDRTYGTAFRGEIAEKFNYLPELWLAQWPSDGTGAGSGYDAITALPPVL